MPHRKAQWAYLFGSCFYTLWISVDFLGAGARVHLFWLFVFSCDFLGAGVFGLIGCCGCFFLVATLKRCVLGNKSCLAALWLHSLSPGSLEEGVPQVSIDNL